MGLSTNYNCAWRLYKCYMFYLFITFAASEISSGGADDIIDIQHDSSSHRLSRHPRDAGKRLKKKSGTENFGSAVYFHGNGKPLKLRYLTKSGQLVLPNMAFTVQFWAKPEGGQNRYAAIIHLLDECNRNVPNTGFTVGIMTQNNARSDARFVFSLLTEGTTTRSHLLAYKQYDPTVWTHVAATYDGDIMSLYINGAKTSLGHEQNGVIFSESSSKCKLLFVGGKSTGDSLYRGKIDELRLWNRTLKHDEIVKSMYLRSSEIDSNVHKIFSEPFDDLYQWRIKANSAPEIIKSDIPLFDHNIRFDAPHCGRTVCDDPVAVMSYLNNKELRNLKTVRYRVVNIMEDDGSNPLLSKKQLFEQHKALNKAFDPYSIAFDFDEFEVRNSSLRNKVIMFRCVPYQIGNGECDIECGHSSTGNDGGDCDDVYTECHDVLLGNGICDTECNKAYHGYDNGDCCLQGENVHKTCIDPSSSFRGYANIDDVKMDLKLDGNAQINIFFITATWFRDQFRGVATFPWEKNVYTSIGGNIMHVGTFGNPGKLEALVHELGHNLGLWHVHRGISEIPSCDDPCMEEQPSMILGDMCSDTNPTPKNRYCMDPVTDVDAAPEETCGLYKFVDTPYSNYMSYADDACTDHFTPQQVARMHCYLDLVYQPMRDMKSPPPVPLAPKVVRADDTSVSMVWLEPLGLDTSCDSDDAFYQYADVATSSHNGVRWSPHEATGFPDAKKCSTVNSWMPHYSGTPPLCKGNTCWLELGFDVAVVPKRFNIWISAIPDDKTDVYLELISTSGKAEVVGRVPAYCDMEATVLVNTKDRIKKVRIYISDSFVAIDAVEMVSKAKFHACTKRKSPKYKLTRDPPFADGYMVTAEPAYIDSDVTLGTKYSYRVQSVLDSRNSVISPGLVYTHGNSFCGDGIVDGDEDCDDKNVFDGDGCSIECTVEEGFRCKGDPSLCYIYKDDGVCEDFEKETNIKDCGLFTPEGFIDQWAISAIANPDYQLPGCPASVVAGKPHLLEIVQTVFTSVTNAKCASIPTGQGFWRPCGEPHDVTGHFWLEISIYQPTVAVSVIVHLASDGYTQFSSTDKYIHIELITTDDTFVPLHPTAVPVSCDNTPLEVSVIHDLTTPFFLTKGVRISFTCSSISISAVRVRSSTFINPVEIASCTSTQLYNPRSGHCTEQSCSKSTCGEFPVKHGVAICSGQEDGDTCKIECDKGYYIDGHHDTALCMGRHWSTSSLINCSPIECERPVIQYAMVACPSGSTFSQECHFKCEKPATLVGSDTSITCEENGRWSEQKATCQLRCEPLNAKRYMHGALRTASCKIGPQVVGQQCKVRCDEGYHAEGEQNKKRFLRIVCEDDGDWDGLECVPNQCPPLPTMFKGAYTCTDDFFSGSTCTMSCPGNLTLFRTVTCAVDGKWNGKLSVCPSDATKTCDVVPSSDDILYACADTAVGGKCSVTCTAPNHVPMFRNARVTESSGAKTFEYVDKVECTVMQKWEPNPARIHCVQQCSEWSIGDTICEAENNRAMCEWDGGDCCPSTVDDGLVITLPEYCPIDCKCKDPAAVENRRRKRRHRSNYNNYYGD